MVRILLKHIIKGIVADLQISDRLSIVMGNSGTGKTHVCKMIKEALQYSDDFWNEEDLHDGSEEENDIDYDDFIHESCTDKVYKLDAEDLTAKSNIRVYLVERLSDLLKIYKSKSKDSCVIVADEYVLDAYLLKKKKSLKDIRFDLENKYIVIFNRDLTANNCASASLLEMNRSEDGVYKLQQYGGN